MSGEVGINLLTVILYETHEFVTMSKKDKKKKQKEERLQPELQARHPPTMIRLKYDAAQTTPENARHWAMADGLSADGSMTPEIRRTLRNRARLEVANNAYARGMILTLADVCIGTGPRLQMLSDDEDFNSIIEEEFVAWAEAIRLAERLKTLRMSKIADGESFCALLKNPKVRHPVEIDLRPVETDRVTSPYPTVTNEVDGVEYDSFGNPVQYHVSSEHPGDGSIWHGTFSAIPSEFMLHWYRSDRPGQSRGLPEIMPALPLFAQLRRYTLAVLAAAETAADFAAVMYTDSPAQGDEAEAPTPYDLVPLEKRMLTVMPDGWKIGQIRAEQPTTSYSEFKREILGEIGRCMQVPVNILLGDSSKHNYASGRLDHQSFFKSIKVEQASCEQVLLFPIFNVWYREAVRIGLFTPPKNAFPLYRTIAQRKRVATTSGSSNRDPTARWFWDGMEHVDPLKEAKASAARIDARTSNLAIECAKQGLDWEDVLNQAAKEKERMRVLKLDPDTKFNIEKYKDEEDETNEADAPSEPGPPRRPA